MKSGFTGISFPFRISSKGGVEMSTTSVDDVSHIVDAIKQILLTGSGERKMEYHFSSGIDEFVFEPNDESLKNLLIYQVEKALQELEDRIEVKSTDIICEDNKVYVVLTFKVLIYDTEYTEKIEVTNNELQK